VALGDSYATLAELKSRLRITDTGDDTQLTAALATASRGIEHCTGRQFNDAGSATARVYPPDMGCWARVDDFHTVVGLVVKTDEDDDGTYETTWDAADYQLEPLNGIVDGQTGWPYNEILAIESRHFRPGRRATLQVTARWGWSAVPAPVKEATLILAEDIFKLRDTPFGVGGYAEYGRIRARQNPEVWNRIAPYRRDAVLVG
jgi:hypothetical protein